MAGQKRPAPTLLPAFEPFSSSPTYPRPSKRQTRTKPSEREHIYSKYPTPIPTSTTGILSSSPPQVRSGPSLHRTQSSVSERAPLSAVPSITLPENGELLLMGRSSNSSNYQLSANRLISRVHVEARYIAATIPLEPNKIEIKCKGWNGLKLHCSGRTWELAKDDTFTSETEFAEIMLDVQDARVMIVWPKKDAMGNQSDSSWDDESSPKGRHSAVSARGQVIHSSPLRRGQRIQSPVSPTPAGPSISSSQLSDLFQSAEPAVVQVYEDAASPVEETNVADSFATTQAATSFAVPLSSQESSLSEPEEEENDPDEENDPIVHSFGPFGANLSSRLESFTTASPILPRRSPSPAARPRSTSPSSSSTLSSDPTPILNHVINQLAFSPKSSTPLSDLFTNLPLELKHSSPTTQENQGLTKSELRKMLNAARCIGEIGREGKDAAGKVLESQYYYVPEEDADESRRAAVEGLRKPSLRACRKQHKVCFFLLTIKSLD